MAYQSSYSSWERILWLRQCIGLLCAYAKQESGQTIGPSQRLCHSKKGDPSVCANYRTISLISHASKILLKVILGRITPKTKFEVAEEQAGFRPQKCTHNHLCSLRIFTEKARSRRQPLYMCFVDFEKAFDKVNHKKLWKVMVDTGFAKHLVALIRALYENQKSNVRIHGETSGWFQAKQGVRQGCILSPYLFNIMAPLTSLT